MWLQEAQARSTGGSLHDGPFGGKKFVAPVIARLLCGEARENRKPGLFDRAWRGDGLHSKQRQRGPGQKIGGSRTAGKVQMAAKNAAQPELLHVFESCEPHGIAVHLKMIRRVEANLIVNVLAQQIGEAARHPSS